MKACLETTGMFCHREKSLGLISPQQNEKSTQRCSILSCFKVGITSTWFPFMEMTDSHPCTASKDQATWSLVFSLGGDFGIEGCNLCVVFLRLVAANS